MLRLVLLLSKCPHSRCSLGDNRWYQESIFLPGLLLQSLVVAVRVTSILVTLIPSVDLGFGFQHSILFSRETICVSSWGIDLVSCLLSCELCCWARWRDLSLDFGPSSGRHIHGENNVCPSASPPASSTASLPPHLPPCPLYLLCLPFLHLHHHLLHQHHRLLQNLTH